MARKRIEIVPKLCFNVAFSPLAQNPKSASTPAVPCFERFRPFDPLAKSSTRHLGTA
jgi:hypothetical protein